jgi:hypothetical protein
MLARQQLDIPLVTATVTEYQLHSLRCGCGRVTRADLPDGVADAAISIGCGSSGGSSDQQVCVISG